MENILRRVKGELGYPVVTIELSDDKIEDIIRDSMEFINEYSNERGAITVRMSSGNSIDLNEYPEIYKVVKVMKSESVKSSSIGNILGSDIAGGSILKVARNGYQCGHSIDSAQLIMLSKAQEKFRNSMVKELYFSITGNQLFIADEEGEITLIFIPRITESSLLRCDPLLKDWTVRHASATLKKLLGKARKRYTSNKALFEHDTDIYSEGEEELRNLVEELNNNDLALAEPV